MYKKREDIPNPSKEQVNYWLDNWNKLEDYTSQEDAINKAFRAFASNDDLNNILIKCSILNDFYSTNIFKIFLVAKHILSLNIDKRLKSGDPTLVNEMALVNIEGKDFNFYSFASKYCSHHNELKYPIYDSYVQKVLKYYRDIDHFSKFKDSDLKNYKSFKQTLVQFQEYYDLTGYNLKELDKYLWQFGKKYFPNKYKNESSKTLKDLAKLFPSAYAFYDIGEYYGVCVQESFYYVDKQTLSIVKTDLRYEREVIDIIEKSKPL